MGKIAEEIVNSTKEVSLEVYKDTAQPIVRPIGEILSFLPRTIKLVLSGWEKWLINGEESLRLTAEATRERLKAIPEGKLVEPEPYVAIPAIQQISYCQNSEELRGLYANLIAASMNMDTKWKVHPSFVDMIKQLNPDEARFIKNLVPHPMMIHPLIDVTMHPNGRDGHYTIITNFTNINYDQLEYPENICSYIENLERLKIIEIPPMESLVDNNSYKELENHPFVQNRLTRIKGVEYKYKHKCFKLTSFGLDFISIVK